LPDEAGPAATQDDKMELVLKNANLVLGDEVVRGDIAMREGVITAIDPASRSRDAILLHFIYSMRLTKPSMPTIVQESPD
jgi:urease alpha subunit